MDRWMILFALLQIMIKKPVLVSSWFMHDRSWPLPIGGEWRRPIVPICKNASSSRGLQVQPWSSHWNSETKRDGAFLLHQCLNVTDCCSESHGDSGGSYSLLQLLQSTKRRTVIKKITSHWKLNRQLPHWDIMQRLHVGICDSRRRDVFDSRELPLTDSTSLGWTSCLEREPPTK